MRWNSSFQFQVVGKWVGFSCLDRVVSSRQELLKVFTQFFSKSFNSLFDTDFIETRNLYSSFLNPHALSAR